MKIEQISSQDYRPIIEKLNDWWGGRAMSDMLPRLFFNHFSKTSFIIKNEGEVIAFLVGFISYDQPEEAYIHFVGVNPSARLKGFGRKIYHHFFEAVRKEGVRKVSCVTSPTNTQSIDFHKKMGFSVKESNIQNEAGCSYIEDYDGLGEHRVVFSRDVDG